MGCVLPVGRYASVSDKVCKKNPLSFPPRSRLKEKVEDLILIWADKEKLDSLFA